MSEAGEFAPILIGASYQAWQRQRKQPNPVTLRTDCTVMIVFAVFYIEATIDAIVDLMNMRLDMDDFLNPDNNRHVHPGMNTKMAWFYNEFVANKKAKTKGDFGQLKIYDRLDAYFPGFADIRDFRNDVSHGKIGPAADSLADAEALRQQAKDIRTQLYDIGHQHDPNVIPDTTYWDAISNPL